MNFLSGALNEFDATIDDVRSSIQFLDNAHFLRPRINGILRWEVVDGEVQQNCREFMDAKSFRPEFIWAGLYIRLYGALEQFIRRTIHDVVREIDNSIEKYDDLDDRIKRQNICRTGDALATFLQPPDHVSIDYASLCENIGSCTSGGKTFSLNADAFAMYYSNITAGQLEKVLTRIGIKLNWDDLCQCETLQTFFEQTGNVRRTADEVKKWLNKFTKDRNKIVHNGVGGIVVAKPDLETQANFLSVFTVALADLVVAQSPVG